MLGATHGNLPGFSVRVGGSAGAVHISAAVPAYPGCRVPHLPTCPGELLHLVWEGVRTQQQGLVLPGFDASC